MTKLNFILSLQAQLSAFPQDDVEERLAFYCEMIEDRMEEGLSEEEAVAAIGSVDEIVAQIIAQLQPSPAEASPIPAPKKKWHAWEIVLLILGSPIWFSLLIAVFAVALSLYVSLWSIVAALWSAFAALISCGVAVPIGGIALIIMGHSPVGIALIAAGLVCTGLSIFLFFGCKAATTGTIALAKLIVRSVHNRLFRKERT